MLPPHDDARAYGHGEARLASTAFFQCLSASETRFQLFLSAILCRIPTAEVQVLAGHPKELIVI